MIFFVIILLLACGLLGLIILVQNPKGGGLAGNVAGFSNQFMGVKQTTDIGYGQSTCVGIGGDPIIGTTTKEAVEMFMNDPETDGIIMIGEIGGTMEAEAANWLKNNMRKPVVGFIAGQTAPPGRRMGHAGAIIGGADDTAAAKMKIMKECGIYVVASPADIGKTMAQVLKKETVTAN